VVSIGLACLAGYSDRIGDFLCLSRTIVYFPFFYLGYILDTEKLITWVRKKEKPAILAGWSVIAGLGYVCLFHLDLVMKFKRLFSGRNPFSALAYPQTGGLQRLLYYPAVMIVIFSLIVITPDCRMIITEAGKRTLQVYFFQFSLIFLLREAGVFEFIYQNLSGLLRELAFLLIAIGITIVFSMPMWGRIFRPFRRDPSPP
jgi:fucose 4-O-acetylase-like acetyltransferase